jgi:virginiamycin B lyase
MGRTSNPARKRICLGVVGVAALLASLLALSPALTPRAEAFVYWSANDFYGVSTIGRANPDGTGVEPDFIQVQVPRGDVCGLAVDARRIYWTVWSGDSDGRGSMIGRSNLDGSGVNRKFITGLASPSGIAVDGAHLYWSGWNPELDTRTIGRANLDGTNVDRAFITAWSSQVAVDPTHVYWADGDDAIGRANLDGSDVDPKFITGAHWAPGVAVNATHVYWSNQYRRGGTIGRATLDGSGAEQRFIPVITDALNTPGTLAVDAEHLYWADGELGAIGRANLDGTGVNPRLVRDEGACGVAVDSLHSFSFGKVKRNTRRGTAVLAVKVPDAGRIRLARTKRVKGARKRTGSAATKRLPIKPRGKASRELETEGKARVRAKVTYIPNSTDPNIVANTLTRVVRLVARH